MSQISVTRALAQVKSLNDRIIRGTQAPFISVAVGGKIAGKADLQEAEAILVANLQSVQELIAVRSALKSAIVKSNATAEVEIGGTRMTVAEAIERKTSITLERNLLQQIQAQQSQAIAHVERINVDVTKRVDALLATAFGRDVKVTEEETKSIVGPYEEKNKAKLVDANNLDKVIAKLAKQLDDFLLEVDFALSEVNAKTLIAA